MRTIGLALVTANEGLRSGESVSCCPRCGVRPETARAMEAARTERDEMARARYIQHPAWRLASAGGATQEQPTGRVLPQVLMPVEKTSQVHRVLLLRFGPFASAAACSEATAVGRRLRAISPALRRSRCGSGQAAFAARFECSRPVGAGAAPCQAARAPARSVLNARCSAPTLLSSPDMNSRRPRR